MDTDRSEFNEIVKDLAVENYGKWLLTVDVDLHLLSGANKNIND